MSQNLSNPGQIYVLGSVLNNSSSSSNLTTWYNVRERQLLTVANLMRKSNKKSRRLLGRRPSDFIIHVKQNQTFLDAFAELHGPPSSLHDSSGLSGIFSHRNNNITSSFYPGHYNFTGKYFTSNDSTKNKQLLNENFSEDLKWLFQQTNPLIKYYTSSISIVDHTFSVEDFKRNITSELTRYGFTSNQTIYSNYITLEYTNGSNLIISIKIHPLYSNNNTKSYRIDLSLEYRGHKPRSAIGIELRDRISNMEHKLYEASETVKDNPLVNGITSSTGQTNKPFQVLLDYSSVVHPLICIEDELRKKVALHYISKLKKSISNKDLKKVIPGNTHYLRDEDLSFLLLKTLKSKSDPSLRKRICSIINRDLKKIVKVINSKNTKISRRLPSYASKINRVTNIISLADPRFKEAANSIRKLIKNK